MMSRELDIAWAAGLLEGEGCFGWYGTRSKQGWNLKGYPCVTVCSVDRDVIERVASIFDGSVREEKPTSTGKPVWEFRAINQRAADIMVEIFPLMGVRRQEKIKEVMASYAERAVALIEDFVASQYCPQGHTGEFGRRPDNGSRYCRQCHREYQREYKLKKRLAAAGDDRL